MVLVLLAGVVPLLNGLLFELVLIVPLRVPLDQSPVFYIWQVSHVTHAAAPDAAFGLVSFFVDRSHQILVRFVLSSE